MKEQILEFIQDIYNEEVDKYLTENCELKEEREPYGDTTVVASSDYSDEDKTDAECVAMETLEQALEQALNELKKKEGFTRDDKEVKALAEKAKENINLI